MRESFLKIGNKNIKAMNFYGIDSYYRFQETFKPSILIVKDWEFKSKPTPKLNHGEIGEEALEERPTTSNFYGEIEEIKETSSRFYGEIEEIKDRVERRFHEFKNFSMSAYPPYDHYFREKPFYNCIDAALVKRIQEERGILRQGLPSSIFVRVYESRIDVVRAVIVGREGAPYHQGLFLFDICFPSNSPTQPPQLFYHSYGLDFNPNLPKSGNVSLEGVILKQSNILETLVSIQQLVLMNGKPYLNSEYPRLDGEKSNSKLNKRVFVQTCEAMLRMLKCLPMGFEDFVLGFFRTRAHNILLNYKACADLEDQQIKTLFFKLVKAFEANGTYCRHHYNQEEYDLTFKKEELLSEEERTMARFWLP
ncbi:unnamed protein product [Malus baccata var. baccata]